MSDDLVKRLREDQPVTQDMGSTMQCSLQDAAADRIEELETQLSEARQVGKDWFEEQKKARKDANAAGAKLAKAVEFIQDLTGCEWPYDEDAKRILEELKGQHDE